MNIEVIGSFTTKVNSCFNKNIKDEINKEENKNKGKYS